jgi:tRNA-dependent cyclodipeptide synthase
MEHEANQLEAAESARDLPRVVMNESYGPKLEDVIAGKRPAPAFLAVSLKNKMSNRSHLSRTISWISAHAPRAIVVIGDIFYRHNLMALREMPADTAHSKALRDGKKVTRTAASVIDDLGLGDRVTVITAAELTSRADYLPFLEATQKLYGSNQLYAEDVDATARGFLDRVKPDANAEQAAEMVDRLKHFVLEEVAVSLQLYAAGFIVDVYPGPDLLALRRITAGHHVEEGLCCPDRTYVALELQDESES